jgi:CRP-like cAMP-binding protein
MRKAMQTRFERDVMSRLMRVETKLTRGFEELGVNIDADTEWLTLDEEQRVVYVSTLGRSMTVLLSDMARAGATQEGKVYDIVHRGDVVGSVMFRKII